MNLKESIGLAELVALARFKKLKKLDVSLTHRCNMRCKTCSVWKNTVSERGDEELSAAQYEMFFRKNPYWNWIGLTGGEPFLKQDLDETASAAATCCKKLLILSIATNGSIPERILDFSRWFTGRFPGIILQISVSMDGVGEVHDEIRGVPGSFSKAVKTFRALKRLAAERPMLRVSVTYTISSFNAGSLARFASETEIPVSEIQVAPAMVSYRYLHEGTETIEPTNEGMMKDLRWLLSKGFPGDPGRVLQSLMLLAIMGGERIPCTAGRTSFHMEPDGDIFPCVLLNERISTWKEFNENVRFEPPPDCRCYTPCETYPALLSAPSGQLLRLGLKSMVAGLKGGGKSNLGGEGPVI